MSTPEQRVILVKPDDFLIFGNIGDVPPAAIQEAASALTSKLGIRGVAFFAGDIEIEKVTPNG